jgi:pimeloyl-ACP methyl ester carboxylesterase
MTILQRFLEHPVFYTDAAIGGLLCVAVAGQSVATARERRDFPPPGKLISVGGRRIHIHCIGESASPTVVVSGGIGVWSSQWSRIQRAVATDARMCTWDRPGFGWSDPGPTTYTARQAAEDLHSALRGAGEQGPYLMVGESYGGYVVRLFHDMYASDVAGVVLVESAHERQWEEIPQAKALLAQAVPKLKVAVWLSRIGILRLLISDRGDDLPADVRPALIAMQGQTRTVQAAQHEIDGVFESAHQVAQSRPLDAVPLVVVTAALSFNKFVSETKEPHLRQMNAKWLELQKDLTRLSTNSEHVVSDDATHAIAREQPDVVARAIMHCLQLARRPKVKSIVL